MLFNSYGFIFIFLPVVLLGFFQLARSSHSFASAWLAPIDKPSLLAAMQKEFGLRYEITEATAGVNATDSKPNYYSLNTRAADFGYQPALTSLEGILIEAGEVLLRAREGILA